MKKIIAGLLIWTQIAVAGKLQDADFKTSAELASAGATDAQLLNDTKIYVTGNSLNKTLNAAIIAGDIGGGDASNILLNPGFEKGNVNWTASGGATSTTNSTSKGTGSLGYDWDSNSAAQTLLSDSITIPNGFQGKNGVASCNIKSISSFGTHTFTVNDGTNDIITAQTINGSTTSFAQTKINFVFPSSGTIRIKFASVASNESEIYIDDCAIKLADNIFDAPIMTKWEPYTPTFTGFTSNTSVSYFWRRNGTNLEVVGSMVVGTAGATPGNMSLPTGYNIDSSKIPNSNTTSAAGTQVGELVGSSATQGAHIVTATGTSTTTVYFSPGDATAQANQLVPTAVNVNSIVSSSTAISISFSVPIVGWSNSVAVSADQTDYDWTSYTPTFTGFGTATSIECQHSRVSSDLLLRCKWTTGTPTATEARVSLPNSLTSADTVKIPSIQHAGNLILSYVGNANISVLIEPSKQYVVFGYQGASSSALTKVNGDGMQITSGVSSFSARIPIQGWSSNQRAPTLIGSVTSNSLGAERVERLNQLTACSSSPCTPTSQSGSWVGSTYVRNSTGQYTITPAVPFSSTPTCLGNYADNASSGVVSVEPISGSSIKVRVQDSGFGQTDQKFGIICFGAR